VIDGVSPGPQSDRDRIIRAVMRWSLAAFYVAAGLAHLMTPEKLLAITPSWVLFAPQVIFTTGLSSIGVAAREITGGRRICAMISSPGHKTFRERDLDRSRRQRSCHNLSKTYAARDRESAA
jgi:hypothetical protein